MWMSPARERGKEGPGWGGALVVGGAGPVGEASCRSLAGLEEKKSQLGGAGASESFRPCDLPGEE